jgi:KaiC/GvpD/RAD55 family RecA-like ATPase
MNASEIAILAALTDTSKMEVLAAEGLALDHVPTSDLHPLIEWAQRYYVDSGRTQAPSRAAMLEEWGVYIADNDIELPEEDEEVDTPEWAINLLKANFVATEANQFQMDMAREMSSANPEDRVRILGEHADDLARLVLGLVPKRISVEVREGIQDALTRYHERAANPGIQGMTFGLPEIDEHLAGIRPTELAVVAAGAKTGKTTFIMAAAMNEFDRGRCSTMITMEMTVEEIYDRMACFRLGIDHSLFLRGEITDVDIARIEEYIQDVLKNSNLGVLHIVRPEPGQRTPEGILRIARMRETESLFIDQLTFMEHPDEGKKKRDEVIKAKMHDLKNGLSAGRHEMSCLLAHQINREGVKMATKNGGYLSMEYMADGAEVERTVDLGIGLYQSQAERAAQMMKFQILAARRLVPKNWYLGWRISQGRIKVLRELEAQPEA